MTLDEALEPYTATLQPPVTHRPAWCDPRGCQMGEWAAADRKHVAHGEAFALTLQDEVRHEGQTYGLPELELVVEQGLRDAEPVFCLYSESAKANSASEDTGMDLELTRGEAEQLRDQLSHWLEVTR